jgi:O-antigen ligase
MIARGASPVTRQPRKIQLMKPGRESIGDITSLPLSRVADFCVLFLLLSIMAIPQIPEDALWLAAFWAAGAGLAAVLRIAARGYVDRTILLVLAITCLVVFIAFCRGLTEGNDEFQVARDSVPYVLFSAGILAGMSSTLLARSLWTLWFVSFVESLRSILFTDIRAVFALTSRSTFLIRKITSGFPLMTLYAAAMAPRKFTSRALVLTTTIPVAATAILLTRQKGMILSLMAFAILSFRRTTIFITFLIVIVAGLSIPFWFSATPDTTIYIMDFLRIAPEPSDNFDVRLSEWTYVLHLLKQNPFFGTGLGSVFFDPASNHDKAYVHNIVAYHLWKFGLIGTILLFFAVGIIFWQILLLRFDSSSSPIPRLAIAASVSFLVYLSTTAAFKLYFVSWFIGLFLSLTFHHIPKPRL